MLNIRRTVVRTLGLGVALLGAAAGGLALPGVVEAQGLPQCGGNQTIRPAPRACTNTRVIDGTTFTAVLDVTASGMATATLTIDAPRAVDTPVRVRWHEGISSGPTAIEASNVIPAGSLGPVSMAVQAPACGGQIDVKGVFTDNGDERGRVTAPWISVESCGQSTTTTAAVPTTTVVSTATTAASTGGQVGTTTGSGVAPAAQRGTLPATGGGNLVGLLLGALALLAGAVIVVATRPSRTQIDH